MADSPKCYLGIVLHGHLPYVMAHGRWPHGMDWICEAATECYIPLLRMAENLRRSGRHSALTMGITPVLAEQLRDGDFPAELDAYCEERVRRAVEAEAYLESTGDHRVAGMARWWREYYDGVKRSFHEEYGADLVGAFARCQELGQMEIITCAATHGYLPLLGRDTSVQAQVRTGVEVYEKHFGRKPRGFWLPECAYRPRYEWAPPAECGPARPPVLRKGVDEFLHEAGIRYFIVDTHLLRGGKALGVYRHRYKALEQLWAQFESQCEPTAERHTDPNQAYLTSSAPLGMNPVAFFVRDEDTALQVWSGELGYPGDGWYLDFHKKYFPGGFRFWRVTRAKSDLAEKDLYDWRQAQQRIPSHADHFVSLVASGAAWDGTGAPPIRCCPFDAELFGHWWHEGPEWLEAVLERAHDHADVHAVSLGDYLERHEPEKGVGLPEGSWGEGGYHFIWLNQMTSWTWTRIYEAEDRMAGLLARAPADSAGLLDRVLKQAARELLLLQSSDWQFLISTWNARDYAELRFEGHRESFARLALIAETMLDGAAPTEADVRFLEETEARDRLFADINLKWFRDLETPV
ncbi:MAG TPA: DUF1957 domain-containing protein [Armatimonadota bacterium]|nr:DUF1957 domain-containing protein [Armatimonadota bacterium]